ncbi:MAG: hypothetical protein ACYSTF_05550 [Planctomycetota bacterium]
MTVKGDFWWRKWIPACAGMTAVRFIAPYVGGGIWGSNVLSRGVGIPAFAGTCLRCAAISNKEY